MTWLLITDPWAPPLSKITFYVSPPPLHAKCGSSELRCKSFFKVVNQCSSMCSGGILRGNNNHLVKYERPYFVIWKCTYYTTRPRIPCCWLFFPRAIVGTFFMLDTFIITYITLYYTMSLSHCNYNISKQVSVLLRLNSFKLFVNFQLCLWSIIRNVTKYVY